MFANGFGLRPFVLDGVEVWRVRREVFEDVTGLAKGLLNIGAFVEGGVIQDDNGGRGQLGQEDVLNPGEEDIGVDTAFKKTDGDQMEAEQGTDDVGAAPGLPVKAPLTALPQRRIPPAAGHILGKAAFVNPHQRPPGRFIPHPAALKGAPCGFVRTRMHGCFFYRSLVACSSARSRWHSASPPIALLARTGRHRGSPAGLGVRPPCPACACETPRACAQFA